MTANEILADHFIRAAPIAAVYVERAGKIDAIDVVGIDAPPGAVLLCCAAGRHGGSLPRPKHGSRPGSGLEAALAALRAAAATAGVGLTPHRAVVQRALAAVETVNDRIADLQRFGGMKGINAEFEAARAAGSIVRYRDFLHWKKMAMLQALATKIAR